MLMLSIRVVQYAHAEHAHNYRKFEYLGEFLKKMEIARDPNFLALLGLVYAKKTPSKISRLGTFKVRL
jgi:hypothetical protein